MSQSFWKAESHGTIFVSCQDLLITSAFSRQSVCCFFLEKGSEGAKLWITKYFGQNHQVQKAQPKWESSFWCVWEEVGGGVQRPTIFLIWEGLDLCVWVKYVSKAVERDIAVWSIPLPMIHLFVYSRLIRAFIHSVLHQFTYSLIPQSWLCIYHISRQRAGKDPRMKYNPSASW